MRPKDPFQKITCTPSIRYIVHSRRHCFLSMNIHTCWCSRDERIDARGSQKEEQCRLKFHFCIENGKSSRYKKARYRYDHTSIWITLSLSIANLFSLQVAVVEIETQRLAVADGDDTLTLFREMRSDVFASGVLCRAGSCLLSLRVLSCVG